MTSEAYNHLTTEELFQVYKQTPSDELKWEIVMRHMGIVKNIALQIQGVYSTFAQLDDIVDEGLITLARSVDKYDPSIGKFETYVAKRIRGMVVDLARRQDWVPRPVRKKAKEIDRTSILLFNELGRYPTDQEVADRLMMSVEEYQSVLSKVAMYSIVSLEETLENYDESNFSDQFRSESPDEMAEQRELLELLSQAITSLRPKEQIVLSLYYQKGLKMKEVANVLGVSHARASQIHTKALQKLKLFFGV